MRILLIISFLIACISSQAQNPNFKPTNDEFSKEFVRLVDSARTSIYGVRTRDIFDRSTRKWIKLETPFNDGIDSAASLACLHNNKFFYNLVANQELDPIIIGHVNRNGIHGTSYTGTDTILYDWKARCSYYCGDSFYVYGECVWAGYTDHPKYKNMNSADLARAAFNIFMQSKEGHKEILMSDSHTDMGINLMIDPESKRFYITVVTGIKKANN